MTIRVSDYSRLLLLTGVLAMVPVQLSGHGLTYEKALAEAGGQNKGNGQGAARGGSNGVGQGGGIGASGGSLASAGGLAKGQNYKVSGRINALVKSNAWNNPNSRIGRIALTLTATFESYLSAAASAPAGTVVPTSELASVLATIANKELTQADLDAIEARIAQENPENSLFQSLVDPSLLGDPTLATTNLQLQTTLQSLDTILITEVNGVDEANQGLGPLY
jgi:hypothetical protein